MCPKILAIIQQKCFILLYIRVPPSILLPIVLIFHVFGHRKHKSWKQNYWLGCVLFVINQDVVFVILPVCAVASQVARRRKCFSRVGLENLLVAWTYHRHHRIITYEPACIFDKWANLTKSSATFCKCKFNRLCSNIRRIFLLSRLSQCGLWPFSQTNWRSKNRRDMVEKGSAGFGNYLKNRK